jgi:coenzyme F420 biosynthesis associated uncharacterized protein
VTSALIDSPLASTIGRRLASPGPVVSAGHARAAVSMLRELSAQAQQHVAEVTGLTAAPGHPAVVVDRAEWIDSNVDALAALLSGWTPRKEPAGLSRAVGSRALAVQVGVSLSWLSSKVLGQYEVFSSQHAGRLLLVAPNIVEVEQALSIDPRDFRLWVCLHEETHRVQFSANPWLADHLRGLIVAFLEASDVPPHQLARQVASMVHSGDTDDAACAFERSWFERMQSPAQREAFDQLTAVMSLLEGHADVVMDEVGPQVVGSVAWIRARFQERRTHPSTLDRIIRSALGMDAKLRQYADGAVFVRHVVDAIGIDGFNRVWQSATQLPSRTELHDPDLWIARTSAGVAA